MTVDNDGGLKRRKILFGTLVLGVLAIFVRVAAATGSLVWALGLVAGLLVLFLWIVARSRRRTEAQLTASLDRPPSVNAALDFESLPEDWRSLARETLSAAGASAPAMNVTVTVDGGWLLIEKRRLLGGGKTPFKLCAPLAALLEVGAAKPKIGVVGSSLTFALSTGETLVFDVMAGQQASETLARRFREAALAARTSTPPGPMRLEIVTEPPPPRTSSNLASVMMMACFIPFAIAMAGAVHGPVAALASMFLMFAALGLLLVRPVRMGHFLAVGAWVTAGAFVIDAARTGDYLRLVGAATSIALARWFESLAHRAA